MYNSWFQRVKVTQIWGSRTKKSVWCVQSWLRWIVSRTAYRRLLLSIEEFLRKPGQRDNHQLGEGKQVKYAHLQSVFSVVQSAVVEGGGVHDWVCDGFMFVGRDGCAEITRVSGNCL